MHALPFEDGTFDAAFVHAVMEHIAEPVAALAEVRRVLKPGRRHRGPNVDPCRWAPLARP